MNKSDSKKIAETITNEELVIMFQTAKELIKNWSVVSICNKGLSKGIAWNILASDFDITKQYSLLAKINMIREFGYFLPATLKPTSNKIKVNWTVAHQEPIFK